MGFGSADSLPQLPEEPPRRHLELVDKDQPDACRGKFARKLSREPRVPTYRQLKPARVHPPAQIQQLLLAPANSQLTDDVHDPDPVSGRAGLWQIASLSL